MPRSYLKEEEIAEKVKEFLNADKDDDCKITIKQMCKILEHDYKALIFYQHHKRKDIFVACELR